MRTKHQNIGQWRATLYQNKDGCLLKISALVPTNALILPYKLIPIEHYSEEDYGRIYRLEGAEQLNIESETESYFCLKDYLLGQCPYKKAIVIGFRPGEQRSFLIALIEITGELDTP